MPFPPEIEFYLNNNMLTQQKAETLTELEIKALSTEFARHKFLNGIEHASIYKLESSDIEIKQSFKGKEAVDLFLEGSAEYRADGIQFLIGVQTAIDKKILSFEQAIKLPSEKIFILGSPLLMALIASGEASVDGDSGLLSIQQHPITNFWEVAFFLNRLKELQTHIEQHPNSQQLTQSITFQGILSFFRYTQLFTGGVLELDELLGLTMEQSQSLERMKELVYDSFGRPIMGGTEASVISGILERDNQVPGRIHDMLKNKIISKEDMLNFPKISSLRPALCSLIVNGIIPFKELPLLTEKEKIYLNGYNAHDLILSGIVKTTDIYKLTPNKIGDLERLNLRNAEIQDLVDIFGETIYAALRERMLSTGLFFEKNLKICQWINGKTPTLKLPVIVQEEAIHHLKKLSNPQTSGQFIFLSQSMIGIEKTKIPQNLWNMIKEPVSKRIWDKVHGLFSSRNDPKFIELIESGQHIKLNRSAEIQTLLLNSEGYRKYCSHALFNIRFFQSSKLVKPQDTKKEHDDTHQKNVTYSRI